MTTPAADEVQPRVEDADLRRAPRAPRQRTGYDVWRWCLVAGNVLLLVVAVLLGARAGSWSALEAGVRSGEIASVSVAGGPDGYGGSYDQEVTWRDGLVQRRVEVWVSPLGSEGTSTLQELPQDVGRVLTELRPGLEVERESRVTDASVGFWGWQLPWPNALGPLMILGWACWLGVLVHGPAPWRATRWAWFWLSWVPGGVVAHLLLAGPTPLVPGPRRVVRRLTGGWAFLLSLLLAPLVEGLFGLRG